MYSPYDMVPMVINGKDTMGRPFEFDSDIVDFNKMENAFGKLVKPSKLSTICPDCGQGLIVHVTLLDPPFFPVHYFCEYCAPAESKVDFDPFSNPVAAGRMAGYDLDPLLLDPKARSTPTVSESVMNLNEDDVANMAEDSSPEPPVDSSAVVEDKVDTELVAALESKKNKKKKRTSKPKPEPKLEPAEGLDEEVFDDSDLAE